VSRALDARALRDLVLDPGSWRSWDVPIEVGDVPESYAAELARAAERTGQDEAVTTGEGLLRGRRVAVLAGEFGDEAGGPVGGVVGVVRNQVRPGPVDLHDGSGGAV